MDELSLTRRVRLHAQVAQTLEELYGNDVEAHAAELAHHFVQSETLLGMDKLVRYSIMAGERALNNLAYEDAGLHFQRALDAKEDQPVDDETAQIFFGLGRAAAETLRESVIQTGEANLRKAFDYYLEFDNTSMAIEVAAFPLFTQAGVRSET